MKGPQSFSILLRFILLSQSTLERFSVFRGKRGSLKFGIHHDMCAVAFGQQRLSGLMVKLIFELNERPANKLDSRTYENLVIVTRRRLEAATDFSHCYVAIIFLLHQAIFKAELAEQLDSSDLEPDNVIRVINHTHLVRFRVAHADMGFTDVIGILHSFKGCILLAGPSRFAFLEK